VLISLSKLLIALLLGVFVFIAIYLFLIFTKPSKINPIGLEDRSQLPSSEQNRLPASQESSITSSKGLIFDEDKQLFSLYRVSVYGSGIMYIKPGGIAKYTFVVNNLGRNPDTYSLAVSSSKGWANLSLVPKEIKLEPDNSSEIKIDVSVPPIAKSGDVDELKLIVKSHRSPRIFDVAHAQTTVWLGY
jgi:hypothetical protein